MLERHVPDGPTQIVSRRFTAALADARYLKASVRELSIMELLRQVGDREYQMLLTDAYPNRPLMSAVMQWIYAQPETQYLRSSMGSIAPEFTDYMRTVERCIADYPEYWIYTHATLPPLVVFKIDVTTVLVELDKLPHFSFT